MKFLLPLLIALTAFTTTYAQDYTGVWKGTLTTTVKGKQEKLPFKIYVQGRGTNNFNGLTELHMTIKDQDYRYECRLMGSLAEGGIRFRDGEVRAMTGPKDDPNFHWCIKSGILKMDKTADGTRTLSGDVTGSSDLGPCSPSHADLTWQAKDE